MSLSSLASGVCFPSSGFICCLPMMHSTLFVVLTCCTPCPSPRCCPCMTHKDRFMAIGIQPPWVCTWGDGARCRSLATNDVEQPSGSLVPAQQRGGCPRSTPCDALLAEAGFALRQRQLAVRLLWRAWGFPAEYPLRFFPRQLLG
jgi:hypothetical protein